MRRSVHRCPLSSAVLMIAATGGCTSPLEQRPGIVLDGEQYITLPAPLGSHIKRRVKLSELRQPGMSPSERYIISADTDPILMPPPAAPRAGPP